LAAINPLYAVTFLIQAGPGIGFAVLGAAFLAVTGGEAMYADMGHFGSGPIRAGWFAIVLPSLVLNYFGQGALLLSDPSAGENPFYRLAPGWIHYPLVVFATLATIIASQAIISGAFSITQQAIQLGFLPRTRVTHTASHERGQIYIPLVNWLLALGTLGAVVMFGSSDALAGAYGIAVSLLMVITTVLAALVAIQWGYNPLLVLMVNGLFFAVDFIFFAANATKLLEGGWFPLLLAAMIAFLMMTWRRGAMLVREARMKHREPETEFFEKLRTRPPFRVPGTAVTFTAAKSGIPLVLTHHLKHNRVLHERMLVVSAVTTDAPRVPPEERVEVVPMAEGMCRIILRFGFMEPPDVTEGLRLALQRPQFANIDVCDLTYYFRRETVIPAGKLPGMSRWRKELFAAMHLNTDWPAAYFGVPAAQVVEIGLEVEI
ncbi:MAG: KUP/HAK/KT family potassium transporter, partial [Acetobacteraceae bacterium]|nr:KUP/HAK/KT family potassium transporter [Acetobacteraceae bacterium]